MGKHIPLPAEPAEREAEQRRRRTACVRSWRRKRAAHYRELEQAARELAATENANRNNRDLIGL
jgi:hypothetical protein